MYREQRPPGARRVLAALSATGSADSQLLDGVCTRAGRSGPRLNV